MCSIIIIMIMTKKTFLSSCVKIFLFDISAVWGLLRGLLTPLIGPQPNCLKQVARENAFLRSTCILLLQPIKQPTTVLLQPIKQPITVIQQLIKQPITVLLQPIKQPTTVLLQPIKQPIRLLLHPIKQPITVLLISYNQ